MSLMFSVIIPVYRDWYRLQLCLNALSHQSFPRDSFEIIVVNNDPTDIAPVDFKLPINAMLLVEAKVGSYAARNAAIAVAQGAVLAFTDSDCIPEQDWLLNASLWLKDNSIHLIGGQITLFKEDGGSEFVYIYEKHTSFRQEVNVPRGNGVTANLFVRRYIIDDVGRFNLKLNSGGDWEFTQRCVAGGYQLKYADNVVVQHPARVSFESFLKKERRLVTWGIINSADKTGERRSKVVCRQFKYGLYRIWSFKYARMSAKEGVIISFVEIVKLFYRLFVGVSMVFGLGNPKEVR